MILLKKNFVKFMKLGNLKALKFVWNGFLGIGMVKNRVSLLFALAVNLQPKL